MATPGCDGQTENAPETALPASSFRGALSESVLAFLTSTDLTKRSRLIYHAHIASLGLTVVFAYQDNAAGRLQTLDGLLAFGIKAGVTMIVLSLLARVAVWLSKREQEETEE